MGSYMQWSPGCTFGKQRETIALELDIEAEAQTLSDFEITVESHAVLLLPFVACGARSNHILRLELVFLVNAIDVPRIDNGMQVATIVRIADHAGLIQPSRGAEPHMPRTEQYGARTG